jgi:Ca-activated chloride channel family protein
MTSLFNDLIALQHFHFIRPYWFLMLIPAFILLKNLTARDDSVDVWRKIMTAEILNSLTLSGSSNNRFSPGKLLWLSIFLMSIILAGPTWKQQSSPFSEDNSALIIALDVSKTMQQADVQPSRLLRAKQKIIELLALRGDTNTALIAYSGSAHTVMPITNDSEMIRHFLDVLEPKIMPTSGKLPQAVLPLADALLASTNTPGTLLLIGDGASNETVNTFSEFFENNNQQLIVWGIGDSSQISGTQGKNNDADSAIIPMQLAQLEALANESHGRLVLMTHDKQDISKVNNYIENNLVIVEDESRPWHDAGYLLVFLLAALFLLWFRRGWTLQW